MICKEGIITKEEEMKKGIKEKQNKQKIIIFYEKKNWKIKDKKIKKKILD